MVGMLAVALAMFLLSTAMAGAQNRAWRQARQRVHPLGGSVAPTPALTLRGEALFATSLDPDTVLLDCLLGLRSDDRTAPRPLEPVSLRVRQIDLEPPEFLPRVVRAWAERGDRVLVEVPFSAMHCRARLCCGERTLTVAVDNANDVWCALGRTAAGTRDRR
jgi:hypothetical protein